MTSGGTCYHCGEHVTCLPEAVREFMSVSTIREGDYDHANRRWVCNVCRAANAIEQAANAIEEAVGNRSRRPRDRDKGPVCEVRAPASITLAMFPSHDDPSLSHAHRELLRLGVRPRRLTAGNACSEPRDLRASQPWRRR